MLTKHSLFPSPCELSSSILKSQTPTYFSLTPDVINQTFFPLLWDVKKSQFLLSPEVFFSLLLFSGDHIIFDFLITNNHSSKLCQILVIPWTVAYQAPLSMGFSREKYCTGLPFPSPGKLPTQELNPDFPHCKQMFQHALPTELRGKPSWSQVHARTRESMELSRPEYSNALPFSSRS